MEILFIAFGFLVLGFLLATALLYTLLKARFDAQVSEGVRRRSEQWIAKEKEQALRGSSGANLRSCGNW